jgi:hypothetical protein
VKSQDLLILSDVEFLSTVSDYFRGIFDPKALEQLKEAGARKEEGKDGLEETVKASSTSALEVSSTPELTRVAAKTVVAKPLPKTPLPKVKAQLTISNFRVAVIEDVYTEHPQAISLNVRMLLGNRCCYESGMKQDTWWGGGGGGGVKKWRRGRRARGKACHSTG